MEVSISNATVHIITANTTPTEGFVPSLVAAVTGDTIKWVNGNGTHTTASTSIPTGATSWNSPTIGATGFTYVITVPGTYNYTCHPTGGGHMDASIIVTSPPSNSFITIPNDYPTIQLGIDAANAGDTVLVSPGTYFENINFNGKNITVGSLFLTTGDKSYISLTMIDGRDSSSVVTFTNGEDTTALITGFTIRHGYGASWLDGNGGGICCINSSPTIDNNLIDSNNVSFADGGGIYCENSSAIITNNSLIYNGGNYVLIGTGIACKGGSPYIARNLITGSWGDSHNGIDLVNSNATIVNNTIVNNGKGILVQDSSYVIISNTIIWGNSFASLLMGDSSNSISVTYSDIEGGWSGLGNLNTIPVFIDTGNYDFRLQSGSPCIDAGDPSSPNDPDGSRADMGALLFDQNVGINNYLIANAQNNIKIFPNPFSTSATLEFENEKNEKYSLHIYNTAGQLVRKIDNITNTSVRIKRENLNSGLYFFQLLNNTDGVGSGKIMIE